MIVVSGVIEIGAANREQALAAVVELARATRQESGCISYAFYQDLEDPNRLRVFEEWEDAAALERHFRAPHMRTFRERLIGVEIVSRKVQRYTVGEVSEL